MNKFSVISFKSDWSKVRHFFYYCSISNQFSNRANINLTHKCISDIFKIAKTENAESVAINLDYDNIRHYIHFKKVFRDIFVDSNISTVFFLNKILKITEQDDIDTILDLYHKSLLGGHFGAEKMHQTISKFYQWEHMAQNIKDYVKKCAICEKTKTITNTRVPMQISSLGECLFDHTYMDFVGPISPQSAEGHRYIFTATCDLTKYMIAVPTFDCTALTTADCLTEHVFLRYNFPSRLISDNASNFNSQVIREINNLFKIRKIFTTPYHPQSNIVERGHRTLNSFLRAFTNKNKDTWHLILKFATFAYNNSTHTVTGYTPHELAHGFKIQIPNHLTVPRVNYDYENLAANTRNNIAGALELAKEHLMRKKMINKEYYDSKTNELDVKPNDLILIKNQTKKSKFQEVYDGPFRVIDSSDAYVEILRKNKRIKIHKNLIKKANAQYDGFPVVNLNNFDKQLIEQLQLIYTIDFSKI